MKGRNTVKFGLSNLFIILSICSIFLISCKNDSLELNIKWDTPEKDYKKTIASKVENEEYTINNFGDFQEKCYTKSYSIGGKDFIFDLYLNNLGDVSSGSLRSYTYDIGTTPAKQFLNDTSNVSYSNVRGISKTDFEFIKSYLDDKYGKGVEENNKSNSLYLDNSKTWNYSAKDFDIYLYRSDIHKLYEGEEKNLKILKPFYIGAEIAFKSKSYDELNQKEISKRIKQLKPKDILTFYWKEPYLVPDNFGGEVVLKVEDERYFCNFLHKKILQCKGNLIVKDGYGDVIKEGVIDYVFSSPLVPPGEIGYKNPLSFSISGNDEQVVKLRKMIRSHIKTTIEFDISAIAFEDGTIIRK